jgi:hypothetical protein
MQWHSVPDAELEQLIARPARSDGQRSACGKFIVAFRTGTHALHPSLHELYVRTDRGGLQVWICTLEREGCQRAAEQLVLRRAS